MSTVDIAAPDHTKMSDCAKKIELSLVWYPHGSDPEAGVYQVKQIKNSVWYKPGMNLSVSDVRKLCGMPGWDVVMSDNEIMASILGIFTGGVGKLIP